MASGAEQLVADNEHVKKLVDLYPNIEIIETEGDPPERYDIEYTVNGYKVKEDGTPTPVKSHKIRITLPFGYPHFPPTAKPLTPIFHPDIDPDAIRIADFWQDNQSLADLILHIGQMICGNHYQTEEPFNQNAFNWYEKRQEWLPFDTLEPRDTEELEENAESTADDTEKIISPAVTVDEIPLDVKGSSGESLDILKDDLTFPFDEEELLSETADTSAEDNSLSEPLEEPEGLEEDSETFVSLDDLTEDAFDLTTEEEEEELPFSLDGDEGEEVAGLETDDLTGIDEDEAPLTYDFEDEFEEGLSLDSLIDETEGISDEENETSFATEIAGSDELAEEEIVQADEVENIEAEDIPLTFESEEQQPEDIPLDFESEEQQPEDIPLDFESEEQQPEDIPLNFETEEQSDEGESEFALSTEATESENVEDQEEEEFQVIDDESLAGLELGDEEPINEADEDIPEDNISSIRSLLEQKEIYTAKKIIAGIPDPNSVPDLEEFQQTIADAISEAEELYKKADKLEQAGELEKAGLTLDLVANIAVDYPGLEFARNRIRESMIASDGRKEEAEPSKETGDDSKAIKKKKGPKLAIKLPIKAIAIVLVIIGVLGGAAYVFINDSDNIKVAKANFKKAEQLLEIKEYKQAQKSLNDASSALSSLFFLQKGEKDNLQKKIQGIVNSQSFIEGLKGRVLYNGSYVSVEEAKVIDHFNELLKKAESLQNSGKVEKAIATYESAILSAQKIDFAEQEKNIRQTINNLQLDMTLAAARKSEEEQEWKQAAETYEKALEMSKSLSTADDKDEIANRLAAASLRHELVQGQKAFTASEWQKTIEMLQRAQNILATNPEIASESEKEEINKLLVNTKLYHILSGAKNAFEKKEWEMAINEYKNAIDLLEHNKEILGDGVSDSIRKIERTILMTQISREQNINAEALEKNDPQTSLESYRAIAMLIDASTFKDDEILKEIFNNAQAQTVSLEHEIKINRRIDWLEENYEEIFRKMYPSASSSELLKPKATFIKEEDEKLIFNIGCVEKRQGRKFRLELNYQYDVKSDSWSIYSGKL